ncbi:unnamed protein product [Gadus morhua 'NCC']
MASANTSGSEENFSCSICLDVFNSPVSTPCGHNFCRTCITKYWDEQVKFKCPLCNMAFNTKPDLRVNTLLSELATQFQTSIRAKDQLCVKPGEVPCDVCTGTQLKAMKSCLVCLMSFCQAHLEPHQRVAVLKKHRLVEPMDRLEDRMCKKHNQPLELFCQTDQVCVCQFCKETDHKSHPVVPLKEEYEVKTAQLGKMEAEVQQMIQERLNNIQEIKDTVNRSKADADREIADGVHVLTALKRCIEKCQDNLNHMVKERLKSTEKQAEDLIKELEQEIEDLTNRSSEVEQLSHTEDHLHFLQAFRSLKDPPPTRDWTTVEVRPPSYVGTLRRSLDQLEETLNMEMIKLSDAELKRVQQYEVDVTLDPDTAHPELILSEDGKQVHDGGVVKALPDNPKRFTKVLSVLTMQSFSGRFYFEVQVKDKTAWTVGVARESINRKDLIIATPETGYWTLFSYKDGLICSDDSDVRLPLRAELQKVGVFVDYDEGLVSFYDVEARVHIYSATGCSFTEPLYPILCPWFCDYEAPNPRFFFSYAKKYSKLRSNVGPLRNSNNDLENNPKVMADILQRQYVSVFSDPSNPNLKDTTEQLTPPSCSISDLVFRTDDIIKAIDEIGKFEYLCYRAGNCKLLEELPFTNRYNFDYQTPAGFSLKPKASVRDLGVTLASNYHCKLD